MYKVDVNQGEYIFNVPSDSNLLEVLVKKSVLLENPCNGNGTCGKCKVKLSGSSRLSSEDVKHLSTTEINNGIRLACRVTVQEDISVELEKIPSSYKILEKGLMPIFDYHPSVIIKGDMKYGLAVDIGTTTIVMSLIDLPTGNEMATTSLLNSQKKYGQDVLTRISYVLDHETGSLEMKNAIVENLNQMILNLVADVDIKLHQIVDMAISANTTMLHFLLAEDVGGIGRAPYKPSFIESKTLLAADVGIKINEHAYIYCLPSVSGYIGSDIVAGCLVSDLAASNETTLFIDIGTNGELVLCHNNQLLSCSCAAGPALEGMNISAGVKAQDGAIEECRILKETIELSTIGGSKPIGICGSGILAIVRELIHHEIITNRGTFLKLSDIDDTDYRKRHLELEGRKRIFQLSECGIKVTQSDIRQVQLAKGAIMSGIKVLCERSGISIDDISRVIIAGQFGSHLSESSLIGTGLLPVSTKGKIEYLGNTSKSGAYMALMSSKIRRQMEELASGFDCFELSDVDGYDRIFAKSLLFDF